MNAIESAVKLTVPVLSKSELALRVSVFAPAFALIAPDPELMVVFALSVIPAPCNEMAAFVALMF